MRFESMKRIGRDLDMPRKELSARTPGLEMTFAFFTVHYMHDTTLGDLKDLLSIGGVIRDGFNVGLTAQQRIERTAQNHHDFMSQLLAKAKESYVIETFERHKLFHPDADFNDYREGALRRFE